MATDTQNILNLIGNEPEKKAKKSWSNLSSSGKMGWSYYDSIERLRKKREIQEREENGEFQNVIDFSDKNSIENIMAKYNMLPDQYKNKVNFTVKESDVTEANEEQGTSAGFTDMGLANFKTNVDAAYNAAILNQKKFQQGNLSSEEKGLLYESERVLTESVNSILEEKKKKLEAESKKYKEETPWTERNEFTNNLLFSAFPEVASANSQKILTERKRQEAIDNINNTLTGKGKWAGIFSKEGTDNMVTLGIGNAIDNLYINNAQNRLASGDVSESDIDLLKTVYEKNEIDSYLPKDYLSGINTANSLAYTGQFLATNILTGGSASLEGLGVSGLKELGVSSAGKAFWTTLTKGMGKRFIRNLDEWARVTALFGPVNFMQQYGDLLQGNLSVVKDSKGQEKILVTEEQKMMFVNDAQDRKDNYLKKIYNIKADRTLSYEEKQERIKMYRDLISSIDEQLSHVIDKNGNLLSNVSKKDAAIKTAGDILKENWTETFVGNSLGRFGSSVKMGFKFLKPNRFSKALWAVDDFFGAVGRANIKGVGINSTRAFLNKWLPLGSSFTGFPEELIEEYVAAGVPTMFYKGWKDDYAKELEQAGTHEFFFDVLFTTALIGGVHAGVASARQAVNRAREISSLQAPTYDQKSGVLTKPLSRKEARKKYNENIEKYKKIQKGLDSLKEKGVKNIEEALSLLSQGYLTGDETIVKNFIEGIQQLKTNENGIALVSALERKFARGIIESAISTGTLEELQNAVETQLLDRYNGVYSDAEKNVLSQISKHIGEASNFYNEQKDKYHAREILNTWMDLQRARDNNDALLSQLRLQLKPYFASDIDIDNFLNDVNDLYEKFVSASDVYYENRDSSDAKEAAIKAQTDYIQKIQSVFGVKGEAFNLDYLLSDIGKKQLGLDDKTDEEILDLYREDIKRFEDFEDYINTRNSINKLQEKLDRYTDEEKEEEIIKEVKEQRKKDILSSYFYRIAAAENLDNESQIREASKHLAKGLQINISDDEYDKKLQEFKDKKEKIQRDNEKELSKTEKTEKEEKNVKKKEKKTKATARKQRKKTQLENIKKSIELHINFGILQEGDIFKIVDNGYFIVEEEGRIRKIPSPSAEERRNIKTFSSSGERLDLPALNLSEQESDIINRNTQRIDTASKIEEQKANQGVLNTPSAETTPEGSVNEYWEDWDDNVWFMPNMSQEEEDYLVRILVQELLKNNMHPADFLIQIFQSGAKITFEQLKKIRDKVLEQVPDWNESDEHLKAMYSGLHFYYNQDEYTQQKRESTKTSKRQQKQNKKLEEQQEKQNKELTSSKVSSTQLSIPISNKKGRDYLRDKQSISVYFNVKKLNDRNATIKIGRESVLLHQYLLDNGININEVLDKIRQERGEKYKELTNEELLQEIKNRIEPDQFLTLIKYLPIDISGKFSDGTTVLSDAVTNTDDETFFSFEQEFIKNLNLYVIENNLDLEELQSFLIRLSFKVSNGEIITEDVLLDLLRSEGFLTESDINTITEQTRLKLNSIKLDYNNFRERLALSNGNIKTRASKSSVMYSSTRKPLSKSNPTAVLAVLRFDVNQYFERSDGDEIKRIYKTIPQHGTKLPTYNGKVISPRDIEISQELIERLLKSGGKAVRPFILHRIKGTSRWYAELPITNNIADEEKQTIINRLNNSIKFIKLLLDDTKFENGQSYNIDGVVIDSNNRESYIKQLVAIMGQFPNSPEGTVNFYNEEARNAYLKNIEKIEIKKDRVELPGDLRNYTEGHINELISLSEFKLPLLEFDDNGNLTTYNNFTNYQQVAYSLIDSSIECEASSTRFDFQALPFETVAISISTTEEDDEKRQEQKRELESQVPTLSGHINNTDELKQQEAPATISLSGTESKKEDDKIEVIRKSSVEKTPKTSLDSATESDYTKAIMNNYSLAMEIFNKTLSKLIYVDSKNLNESYIFKIAEEEFNKKIETLKNSDNEYAKKYGEYLEKNKNEILGFNSSNLTTASVKSIYMDFFHQKGKDEIDVTDEGSVEKNVLDGESFEKPIETTMSMRLKMFVAGIAKSPHRRTNTNPFVEEYEDYGEMLYGIEEAFHNSKDGTLDGAIQFMKERLAKTKPNRKIKVEKDNKEYTVETSLKFYETLIDRLSRLKVTQEEVEEAQKEIREENKNDKQNIIDKKSTLLNEMEYILYLDKVTMVTMLLSQRSRTNEVGQSITYNTAYILDANRKSATEKRKQSIANNLLVYAQDDTFKKYAIIREELILQKDGTQSVVRFINQEGVNNFINTVEDLLNENSDLYHTLSSLRKKPNAPIPDKLFNTINNLFKSLGLNLDACTIISFIENGDLLRTKVSGSKTYNYPDVLSYLSDTASDLRKEYKKDVKNNKIYLTGNLLLETCDAYCKDWVRERVDGSKTDGIRNIKLPAFLRVDKLKSTIIPKDIEYTFNPVGSMYVNGKHIQPFEQPRFIHQQLKLFLSAFDKSLSNPNNSSALTLGQILLNNLKRTPTARYNRLIEILSSTDPKYDKIKQLLKDNLSIEYSSLNAYLSNNGVEKKFVELPPQDQLTILFALLSNAYNIGKIGEGEESIQLQLGRLVFPPLSDAGLTPIMKTVTLLLTKENLEAKDGRFLNQKLNEILYNQLVKGELLRIIAYNKSNTKTNVTGIDSGSLIFNTIPSLNAIVINGQTLPQYIKNVVENNMDLTPSAILNQIENNIKIQIEEELYHVISTNATEMENKLKGVNTIDTKYLGKVGGVRNACLNLIINNLLNSADIDQLFASDKAAYSVDKMPKYFKENPITINDEELSNFYFKLIASDEEIEIVNNIINNNIDENGYKEGTTEKFTDRITELVRKKRDFDNKGLEYRKALRRAYQNYAEICETNSSKRFKGLISPGNIEAKALSGVDTRHTIQLMIEDTLASSDALESLFSFHYKNDKTLTSKDRKDILKSIAEFKEIESKLENALNDELSDEEIEQLQQEKNSLKKYLMNKLPKIADYFEIKDTDGQEYCTWRNYLDQLIHQGRISPSKYWELVEKLEDQSRNGVNDNNKLSEEDEIYFQPTKPRYYGMHFIDLDCGNEQFLLQRPIFIKTSSFPLIPQLTKGWNIDRLRILMERLENDSAEPDGTYWHNGEEKEKFKYKTVRASYNSGNKVGGITNAMTFEQLTSDDMLRRVNDGEELPDVLSSTVELDKANYFIQQDKPFDTIENLEKGMRDEILASTQMEKSLLGNGLSKITEDCFKKEGYSQTTLIACGLDKKERLTGKDLSKIYNYLYERQQEHFKNLLFRQFGIKSYEDFGNGASMREIQRQINQRLTNLQVKEGITLIYTANKGTQSVRYTEEAFQALSDEEKSTLKNIKLEFKFPLWLSPNAHQFESILNSIISNKSIKLRFPGSHGIVASQKGFKTKLVEQDQYDGEVILCKDFDGTLKAQYGIDGKIKAAQVFVASKFTHKDSITGKTTLIDMNEYIIEDENGRKYLDPDRVPDEILQQFSFRIPVSSHQSGMLIQIAGFLPPECGDLMIVPKDSVIQMGEDFDIDVRYCYRANVQEVIGEDGIKRIELVHPIKLENQEQFSKAIEDDYYNILNIIVSDKILNKEDQFLKEFGFSELYDVAINASVLKGRERDTYITNVAEFHGFEKAEITIQNIKKLVTLLENKYKHKLNNLQAYVQKTLNDNLKYQELENDLMNLYKSVYSADNELVQQKITAVLSTDFIGRTANLIEEEAQRKSTEYSGEYVPGSVLRQLDMIQRGNAGKVGIGVWSSLLTFTNLIQQCENPIKINTELTFGKLHWDGTLGGKYDEKTQSYKCITPEGASSTSEVRDVADNIREHQNSSTDNQKLQFMVKIEENEYTFSAYQMFALAGLDKDSIEIKGGEVNYAALFISQPIIKDFVSLMRASEANSTTMRQSRKDVIKSLLQKYTAKPYNIEKVRENLTSDILFSYIGGISNDSTEKEQDTFNARQREILNLFIEMVDNYEKIRPYVTALNMEKKGLGVSFFDVIDKKNLFLNLLENGVEGVEGLEQLIGDVATVSDNLSEEEKFIINSKKEENFGDRFMRLSVRYSISSTKEKEKSLFKEKKDIDILGEGSKISFDYKNEKSVFIFKPKIYHEVPKYTKGSKKIKDKYFTLSIGKNEYKPKSIKEIYGITKAIAYNQDEKIIEQKLEDGTIFDWIESFTINDLNEEMFKFQFKEILKSYFSPENNPSGLAFLLDIQGKIQLSEEDKKNTSINENVKEFILNTLNDIRNSYKKEIPTISSSFDIDSEEGLRHEDNNSSSWISAIEDETKTQFTIKDSESENSKSLKSKVADINSSKNEPTYIRFYNPETNESIICELTGFNTLSSEKSIDKNEWSKKEGLSQKFFDENINPILEENENKKQEEKTTYSIYTIKKVSETYNKEEKELNSDVNLPKISINESDKKRQIDVIADNINRSSVTIGFYNYDKLEEQGIKDISEDKNKPFISSNFPTTFIDEDDENKKISIIADSIHKELLEKNVLNDDGIIINITGDNISKLGYSIVKGQKAESAQKDLNDIIQKIISELLNRGIKINKIITTGESGIATAATTASMNLKLKSEINVPKGYTYTNIKGKTVSSSIYSKKNFLKRFPDHETTSLYGIEQASNFPIQDEDVELLESLENDGKHIIPIEEKHGYRISIDGQETETDTTVSKFVREVLGKEQVEEIDDNIGFPEIGSYLGNIYDRMNRDFFAGNLGKVEDYPGITEEQYKQILSKISDFKEKLDKKFGKGKYITITDENLLKVAGYVTIDGKQQLIGGTIDMIIIDENGKWTLCDFKTHRVSLQNSAEDLDEERKTVYYHQLMAYRQLLIEKYPILKSKLSRDVYLGVYNVSYPAPKGVRENEKGNITYKYNEEGILGTEDSNGEFIQIGNINGVKMENSVKLVNPISNLSSDFEKRFSPITFVNEESEDETVSTYTEEQTLKNNGYVFFTRSSSGKKYYIKPNGFYAHKVVNSLSIGYNLWKNVFPYESPYIEKMIDNILSNMDVSSSSQRRTEMKYKIMESYLDSLYSSFILFNSNNTRGGLDSLRRRLFIDDTNNMSFSSYLKMLEIQGVTKMLPFFKNLSFRNSGEKGGLSILIYNVNQEGLGEHNEIYSLLQTLYQLDEEIMINGQPSRWNGEVMTWKKLVQYLAYYSFLANQESGAIGFRQYIPISVFEDLRGKNIKGDSITVMDELNSFKDIRRLVMISSSGVSSLEMLMSSSYDRISGMIPYNISSHIPINKIKDRVKILNSTYNEELFVVDDKGNVHIPYMKYGLMNLNVFVTQFFQHNPELAHRVNIKKSYIDLKTETFPANLVKGNYNYVSIRISDNEYHLFMKEGGYYKRINCLGTYGLNEYKPTVSNTQSIVPSNNIRLQSANTSLVRQVRGNLQELPSYKTVGDLFTDILNRYPEDHKLCQILLLINSINPNIENNIKIGINRNSNIKQAAQYSEKSGKILYNENMMNGLSIEEKYEILLHEYIHAITAKVFKQYIENVVFKYNQTTEKWEVQLVVKDDAPKGFSKFVRVYKQAFLAIQDDKEMREEIFNYLSVADDKTNVKDKELKKKHLSSILSGDTEFTKRFVKTGIYQAADIYEFVADMFFNKKLYTTLLSTQYQELNADASTKTGNLIDKFLEFLLDVLNKLRNIYHGETVVDNNLMQHGIEALRQLYDENMTSNSIDVINSATIQNDNSKVNIIDYNTSAQMIDFLSNSEQRSNIVNQQINVDNTVHYYPAISIIEPQDVKIMEKRKIGNTTYQIIDIPGVTKFQYGIKQENGLYKIDAIIAGKIIITTDIADNNFLGIISQISEIYDTFAKENLSLLDNPYILSNKIKDSNIDVDKFNYC